MYQSVFTNIQQPLEARVIVSRGGGANKGTQTKGYENTRQSASIHFVGSYPAPHPLVRKGDLVITERFFGCASSALIYCFHISQLDCSSTVSASLSYIWRTYIQLKCYGELHNIAIKSHYCWPSKQLKCHQTLSHGSRSENEEPLYYGYPWDHTKCPD